LKEVINLEKEDIPARSSTLLRKNNSQKLIFEINENKFQDLFLINGMYFITEGISNTELIIKPKSYYMVINNGKEILNINYSQDISNHKIIYDPYKYELSKKVNFKPEFFKTRYSIPNGYIDTLPKWYSFKFAYPDYNLIFVRPEFGLSIQIHKYRNEFWEILDGKPIIINGNKVFYFVEKGITFQNPIDTYHSVINPNKEKDKFVVIKESWKGKFDENDIKRVFNPNHYL
jgi:mannose-6-phosphate isomerase-like protein (cupin superfamily)